MKVRGSTPEEDVANGWIEDGVITKVEPYSDGGGWSVSYGNGMGCGVKDVGVEPKVGDTLTTYGQWGYPFHGQALNGKLLWYHTPEEEEAERKQWIEEHDARRKAEFEERRLDLDREYDGLPPLFKMRIDRFRKANPDFRWKYESYEMFVCTQAVLLANWALAQSNDDKKEATDCLIVWWSMNTKDHEPPYDYEGQKAMVPGWSDDHSGNTAGCAFVLAREYIAASERVPLLHGAMAPLVGTTDYSEEEK